MLVDYFTTTLGNCEVNVLNIHGQIGTGFVRRPSNLNGNVAGLIARDVVESTTSPLVIVNMLSRCTPDQRERGPDTIEEVVGTIGIPSVVWR